MDAQPAAAPAQAPAQDTSVNHSQPWRNGLVNPTGIVNPGDRRWSGSTAMSNDIAGTDFTAPQHVPHQICKCQWPRKACRELTIRPKYASSPTTELCSDTVRGRSDLRHTQIGLSDRRQDSDTGSVNPHPSPAFPQARPPGLPQTPSAAHDLGRYRLPLCQRRSLSA
jgi:hypothetical protein